MNDDYLWDRSGPPDPEIQGLEQTLGSLRYKPDKVPPLKVLSIRPQRWWPAAVAAALLIGASTWLLTPRPNLPSNGWSIAEVSGSARIGNRAVVLSTPVATGQVVRTGDDARLLVRSDDVGQIEVAPRSELLVTSSSASREQFSLRRGVIHALIWAPPQRFVVETPSALAIDLGCEYTLSVDDRGDGQVDVQTGWVAFQFGHREVFIPAGASCRTQKLRGPGIPSYRDASSQFRDGLSAYENTAAPGALATVLGQARPRDGVTLWHLLRRVSPDQRAAVFDRFSKLVALPRDLKRDEVLAGDPHAIDLCWNALNLENTDWWREWKRDWKSK